MSDSPQVMIDYYTNIEREKILAMQEGPKLDVLVQKYVFESDVFEIPAGWAYRTDTSWHFIRNYSSSISAAWELVDKLKLAITPQSEGAPEGMAYMVEYENEPHVSGIRVFAKTAPEAICKAALLAVMNLTNQRKKPVDNRCILCNGSGRFQHISGKWFKCYCQSTEEASK